MRIGIFGGTFDPVHIAHIELAKTIKKQFNLEKIIFIPTGNPPHKISRRITCAFHRINMLNLAIENEADFEVSDIEVTSSEHSYSVDTVSSLYEQSKSASADNRPDEFFFIIGADNLADLTNWKDYKRLFSLCQFIVAKRPGTDEKDFDKAYSRATEQGARILVADIPEINIASTDIRFAFTYADRLDLSKVSHGVCDKVRDYIIANNIYAEQKENDMTIEEMQEDLKTLLSEDRYIHSLGVMREAVRIAQLYGADVEKCRVAGLLHDCGKQLTASQYKWLGISESCSPDGFDGVSTDYDDGGKAARHGRAGAILARKRYGITDPDILEAISVHTTGAPEMSVIAQIIFIADFTEEGREGKHSQEVRDKLSISLMDAIVEECDCAIKHNIKRRDRLLSLDTIRTRNWALTQLNRK